MKKTLFILLALLLISPVMHSQRSIEQLFNDFSKGKGVEHVNIGKFTMTFVGIFKNVMGVDGIEVFSFDGCEQPLKDKINNAISSLKDNNYETMVSANEGKERTKVLVKLKDDTIREIVVLTSGDNPAMVRIKGKIKPSDLENVIKNNKSDKK